MYNIYLTLGPAQVNIQTDEKLSFDAIESLLNRSVITTLTMHNAYMASMFKYEQEIENEYECEECQDIHNELE
jgi:hypothetical protein